MSESKLEFPMFIVVSESDSRKKDSKSVQRAWDSHYRSYDAANYLRNRLKKDYGETTIGIVIPIEGPALEKFCEKMDAWEHEFTAIIREILKDDE